MRERLERLWPSLVALVGTVAVVAGLLWVFGGDVEDSTPDDISADAAEPDGEGGAGGDGSDNTATDDTSTSDPTADPADDPTDEPTDGDDEPDDAEPSTAPPELREPVGIANQTDVVGLEELARERLQEGGWEVPAVSGFVGDVPETTVYYPEGQQDAAEALAAQFPEIGRVMPTFEGINNTRLVVILVDDYVDEVGEPE